MSEKNSHKRLEISLKTELETARSRGGLEARSDTLRSSFVKAYTGSGSRATWREMELETREGGGIWGNPGGYPGIG